LAKRKKIRRALGRAGGIIGIKSAKDLADVGVTSAGSNYFANVIATLMGRMGVHPWARPALAGLISYFISRRQLRSATIIGSVLIALSQAGIIGGGLGGVGRTIAGTNNPARGQERMNQANILGRLQ